MDVLDHFSIPYKGLKNGVHNLSFEIDDQYFKALDSDLKPGEGFSAQLELDKRADMSVAEFSITGELMLLCDRCLGEILHPIEVKNTLHIKIGEENPDQYEVMWIKPETSSINLAQYIYECILLAKPLIVKHKDLADCDQSVIDYIGDGQATDSEDDKDGGDNVWGALQGIKFD